MVMKDKIVKNNRKGYYFKFRKVGLGISCGLFLAAIIGVPTYISSQVTTANNISLAEEKDKTKVEEKDSQKEQKTIEY